MTEHADNQRLERALETGRWNVNSLHDYFDMRFEQLELRMHERFAAVEAATKAALESAEKAVSKAESLATIRAEAQNEWRGTVSDILAQQKGREAGVGTTVAFIVAGISLLLAGVSGVIAVVTLLI
jgi:hypothetical protein